ncbi:hypothetical protein AAF712_016181 [Marasmius tenuissimus]|uniref:Uncharacterized protein n=1 Tax=Marasmius tenuissimus TaxID=585030 RepID=A0ABR2Z886_9AGAR
MAALVARCQSQEEAMDAIAALQANMEELQSQIHCASPTPAEPTPTNNVHLATLSNVRNPSTRALVQISPTTLLSGNTPTTAHVDTPTRLNIPRIPAAPIPQPLSIATGTPLPTAPPTASFNPPLSSTAKGKRPAERPAEHGPAKKPKNDANVLVVMGYMEAVRHPASIMHGIMRTLRLSPLDPISANWKKSSCGFIEMYFRSVDAATTYAFTLSANNTDPDLPELHGLQAEVVDDNTYMLDTTHTNSLPGPSNPGPSTW